MHRSIKQITWSQGEHGIVHSFPLMSKGEEQDKRKSIADRRRVLPSMTKGEIVGNIVIDGKG